MYEKRKLFIFQLSSIPAKNRTFFQHSRPDQMEFEIANLDPGMRNIILFSIFGTFLFLNACVQTGSRIQKGMAYFQPSFRGIVLRDENGKEVRGDPDTARFIYLEVKGGLRPQIDSVIYGDKIYAAAIFPIQSSPEFIGKRKHTTESIRLQPVPGNTLWRLELSLIEKKRSLPGDDGRILLKGKNGKHTFQFVIRGEAELEPEFRC